MKNDENTSASASEASASEADAPVRAAEREEARLYEADVASAVAEAARRSGALEAERSKRPPLWLIVFTLAIPLAIGWVWYNASNMRPLDCSEVQAKLNGGDPAEHRHALEWAGKLIDELNQSRRIKGLERSEDEVVPCAETVLTYTKSTPPDPKLYTDLCRALGSFHALSNSDYREQAYSFLFDVMIRTHSGGQEKAARFQAATSLARFGRDFLQGRGVLIAVQDVCSAMLQENSELETLNGAYALMLIGSNRHAQELNNLASKSPSATVKNAAEEAARLCRDRVD